jgi:hypothetical protein
MKVLGKESTWGQLPLVMVAPGKRYAPETDLVPNQLRLPPRERIPAAEPKGLFHGLIMRFCMKRESIE